MGQPEEASIRQLNPTGTRVTALTSPGCGRERRKSGEHDPTVMNKARAGAPLQAQQRAKDLKTNTRKSKNLPVIQVNSPDLICFASFCHQTSYQ